MKYVYNENLELITTTYDEILDEDIRNSIKGTVYIESIKFDYPILEDGRIRERTKEEIEEYKYGLYQENKYNLAYNEIIKDNKIVEYDVKEFEYIENGIIKYDLERKKEELKSNVNNLKHKTLEYGFIFNENLRQPCREQDKTSVTAKILEIQLLKSKGTEWKFFEKDTNKHIYVSISIEELTKLGIMMGNITIKSMKAESEIIEDIEKLTIENIKEYDVESEYNKKMKGE